MKKNSVCILKKLWQVFFKYEKCQFSCKQRYAVKRLKFGRSLTAKWILLSRKCLIQLYFMLNPNSLRPWTTNGLQTKPSYQDEDFTSRPSWRQPFSYESAPTTWTTNWTPYGDEEDEDFKKQYIMKNIPLSVHTPKM